VSPLFSKEQVAKNRSSVKKHRQYWTIRISKEKTLGEGERITPREELARQKEREAPGVSTKELATEPFS